MYWIFCLYVLHTGLIDSQIRAANRFRGASEMYQSLLIISAGLGVLTGLFLLIYLGYRDHWYSPLIIIAAGTIAAGLIFGLLDRVFERVFLALTAFVVWPLAAGLMYRAIKAIG